MKTLAFALTLITVGFAILPGLPAQSATANPKFNRKLLLETTAETSANASIGDINGDGYLDILLVKGRHWPLASRILLGDGKGGFQHGYELGNAKYRSYTGWIADLDGDGDPDIVLSNDAPDPKLIYLNDGKGGFDTGTAFGRPEWETRNIAVVDLNGDRLPDIVVANRSDDPKAAANYVCLNAGGGRFTGDCNAFALYPATTITAADFNRDGRIDLAVPHRDGGQSYVYLAGPDAKFSDADRVAFGPSDAHIRMSATADLNGDGLRDIVAIDDRAKSTTIYFARANGTFEAGLIIGDKKAAPYALAVADLNGDKKTDVLAGYVEARPTIFFNDGSGRKFSALRFGDNKGIAYGFAIDDLNRDGFLDITIARSDAPNVVYFGSVK